MLTKKIQTFITYLFCILCFFPYLSILPLRTDAQPNALILSFVIFVIVLYCRPKIKLPVDFWIFGIIFIYSVFLSAKGFNSNTVRSLINYLSVFIIPSVTYILLKKYEFPYKLLNISIIIWFIVGFIQTFVHSRFLTFLSPRTSGTGSYGRGVTALAPEPTFYAMIAGLLLLLCLLNRQRGQLNRLNIVLCLISICIFSKSATVILLLIITCVCHFFILMFRKRIKYFFILLFFGIILTTFSIIIIKSDNRDNRLFNIVKKIANDPQNIFVADGSVNERFIHFFFPMKGLVDNYMLPNGFNEFNNYMYDIYKSHQYSEYLMSYRDNYTRIMSGYGSIIFELGLFGVYIFISINLQLIKIIKRHFSNTFSLIFLNLMLFMTLPFVTALVPFVIGNIFYLNSKHNNYGK